MMRCWYGTGFLLCVCLLGEGCSSSSKEPKKVQVSGTVTIDGNPLSDGDIAFVGEAGSIPDIVDVKGGSFEGKVKLGQKKVEIRAYKTTPAPKTSTGGATEQRENYIPAKFNAESALTAEVTDSGVSPNKFAITSK